MILDYLDVLYLGDDNGCRSIIKKQYRNYVFSQKILSSYLAILLQQTIKTCSFIF